MNILFVAEASAGKSYGFYLANTLLFDVIREAFEGYFNRRFTNDEFLVFFHDCGCVLEHLCEKTITKENKEKRAAARRKCIPDLAEKIKKEQPKMMIVLLSTIVDEVLEAVQLADTGTVRMVRSTVYPSKSDRHKASCIKDIERFLAQAAAEGLLLK